MQGLKPFTGIYSALATPFDREGAVDVSLLLNTMAWQSTPKRSSLDEVPDQAKRGVDGFVLYGTTGEAPTLSLQDKELITVSALERAPQLPLIAGIGTNCTRSSAELAKYARSWGAHAGLLVTPYYNKPSQEGLYRHVCEVAEAVPDWPLILYVVPARTAVHLDLETVGRILDRCSQVCSIKDATGDLDYCGALVELLQGRATVLSGDDLTALPAWTLGARGSISVCSNLIPHQFSGMWSLHQSGQREGAADLFSQLLPLIEALFIETNPAPLKSALNWAAQRGLLTGIETWSPELRLPLCALSEANQLTLHEVLSLHFRETLEGK